MSAIPFALATFVSTAIGGVVALRFRDRLHLILGFTAGVLLGVVCFDILPEVFSLSSEGHVDPMGPMSALVIGFLVFHGAEKLMLIHSAQEESYVDHHHPRVGVVSAIALIGHSFMDGVGIGVGFQVNRTTGIIVALAVIAHDFADGLNTVSLMLAHRNTKRNAIVMLAIDALAPTIGAASTLLWHAPQRFLALYLGFFGGVLLYLGAADILPEAHSEKRSQLTIVLTCVGAAFVYLVARAVG